MVTVDVYKVYTWAKVTLGKTDTGIGNIILGITEYAFLAFCLVSVDFFF